MQLDFSIKKMMFLTFSTNALNESKMHLDLKFKKKKVRSSFHVLFKPYPWQPQICKVSVLQQSIGQFYMPFKNDLDLKLLMQLKMYNNTYHIIFQPIFLLSKDKIIINYNITETSSGSCPSQYDILNEEYPLCDLLFEHLVYS